jgi:ATP-binding cassette subfamily B protein
LADEKKMKKYYLRYWWLALLAMLCKGLEVMADLVQPALMASIVDEGILGIGNGGTADLSIVKSLGLKMLVIIAAGGFAGWIGGVFSNNYGQRSGMISARTVSRKCCTSHFRRWTDLRQAP